MIVPCIDLLGGKVVQLEQGERMAIELDSPTEIFRQFEDFPLIHVIDLDAAKGQGNNSELVRQMARSRRARVGGGVRTIDRAKQLIDLGAEQIIVGTRAFTSEGVDHDFLQALASGIGPARTVIAVDVKHGQVAVKGWRETLDRAPADLVGELEPYCAAFLCTYVDKEGLLQGTDLPLFLDLKRRTSRSVIAAGGITTMDEVRTLVGEGIQVALGMAIYRGRLDLQELRKLVG
jgi:phosphoribosylformimino-5-aminoimidazole carboxamide ribotide isomerase